MASIIEELKKKQQGYSAAMEAIKGTKPQIVAIEQKNEDEDASITIFYDPADEKFTIRINHLQGRYERDFSGISVADTKLILFALKRFFEEGTNAD